MNKVKKFVEIVKFCWSFGETLSAKIRLIYLLTKPAFNLKTNVERIYRLPCVWKGRKMLIYLREVDVIILREMFEWQDYKPAMPNLNPKVIWDVGANIGLAALYLSCLYPKAVVIGFEPSPNEIEIAQEHYKLLPSGSELKPLALGKENTDAIMLIDTSRAGGQHLEMYDLQADEKWQRQKVTLRRADSLIKSGECPRPQLLKLDVEGAEFDVLLGFGEFLNEVKWIVMEAHSQNLYEKCYKLLSDHGFEQRHKASKGNTDTYFLWFERNR